MYLWNAQWQLDVDIAHVTRRLRRRQPRRARTAARSWRSFARTSIWARGLSLYGRAHRACGRRPGAPACASDSSASLATKSMCRQAAVNSFGIAYRRPVVAWGLDAVRRRSAAHPASGKGAHHRRTGYRRTDRSNGNWNGLGERVKAVFYRRRGVGRPPAARHRTQARRLRPRGRRSLAEGVPSGDRRKRDRGPRHLVRALGRRRAVSSALPMCGPIRPNRAETSPFGWTAASSSQRALSACHSMILPTSGKRHEPAVLPAAQLRLSPTARRCRCRLPASATRVSGSGARPRIVRAGLKLVDLSVVPRWGLKGREVSSWLDLQGAMMPRSRQPGGAAARRIADRETFARRSPHPLAGREPVEARRCDRTPARAQEQGACYPVPRRDSHCWFVVAGQDSPAMFAKLCGVDLAPGSLSHRADRADKRRPALGHRNPARHRQLGRLLRSRRQCERRISVGLPA